MTLPVHNVLEHEAVLLDAGRAIVWHVQQGHTVTAKLVDAGDVRVTELTCDCEWWNHVV